MENYEKQFDEMFDEETNELDELENDGGYEDELDSESENWESVEDWDENPDSPEKAPNSPQNQPKQETQPETPQQQQNPLQALTGALGGNNANNVLGALLGLGSLLNQPQENRTLNIGEPKPEEAPQEAQKEPVQDEKQQDDVNSPQHYRRAKYETIQEMIIIFGPKVVHSYCICNAWKYRARAMYKGTPEKDMKKSDWYINMANEILSGYADKMNIADFYNNSKEDEREAEN